MHSTPLTLAEIDSALDTLHGWTFEGDEIAKNFKFADFKEALAFMVRVGDEAEAMDHHPDWSNSYNRVSIRLTTHFHGGRVTAKDIELARRIEKIAPAK